MTDKAYDNLKWVALILLPALGTLYFALGQIWGLPFVEQVVGTVAALDTFLGLLLNKSSKDFQKVADTPTIIGNIIPLIDKDGSPDGFRLQATVENPIFEEGKLSAFRVTSPERLL